MSASLLAFFKSILNYGFCTNREVSVLKPLSFELLLRNTFIGIYIYIYSWK